MPINRPTPRGKAGVAAAIVLAGFTGWAAFTGSHLTPAKPNMTPALVHEAIKQGVTPPAVFVAIGLIKKWEGLRTVAYLDMVGKPTIGYGDTMLDGKPVKLGMTITAAKAEAMLLIRVERDFYLPLVDGVKDFARAPDSVQGALISLAYNVGTGAARSSSAARDVSRYDYKAACEDLSKFNRAAGRPVQGLTNRRGMGDPGRAGEGELCVSGLAGVQ
ncbi:lysozyme [Rhizobium sp. VS19-DR104.2]|uniref:lysozyme n=1 Tax=unclassified Rhizobium TaxID=2613769 RepID=UPI001CC3EBCB|nr:MULTISPECIES: lysozyme [unclassified Rhizobium]MBZ5757959.1 lysozyme [Rhizobium sp. VS19-DR96]MBZ5765211.1 lysozyme [Rhizobium sp. VS19-DR129.2]MBZ5772754.1 lysozyme [Rhizobium sp. VS19-DRK62.2]MBZ5782559.1 lysozyme [Rhizobium sp. VS19-DR121]MBZ5800007.1 lysozyme [Rhizobium sp. VS19-DR181]